MWKIITIGMVAERVKKQPVQLYHSFTALVLVYTLLLVVVCGGKWMGKLAAVDMIRL